MTAPSATPASDPDLRLLVGAAAIAEKMGITQRQLNKIRERALEAKEAGQPYDCPIGKIPGLGLTARVATLDDWLARHGVV